MTVITVDDELPMLQDLTEAVKASKDVDKIKSFSSCTAALEWAGENRVDIAFLDIHMRGMGGLVLAEKLMTLQPECRIVFCTGYLEYAVDAFRMHVSGYLMKPITPEAIQREINYILGNRMKHPILEVRCFGSFEVFLNGEPLVFRRSRTKELMAYLVDRNGAGVSARQICAVLWESDSDDTKNMNYLRQLVSDLRFTLRNAGAEDVFQTIGNQYFLDMDWLDSDYARYLKTGEPHFYGEYMSQYSWAEATCALLMRK